MKITEISKPILDTLRNKEFKGNFEVTIYHPDMKAIKIDGDFIYDSNFRGELEYQIKNICFQIVSGVLVDGKFTFAIRGQIEYVYEYKE